MARPSRTGSNEAARRVQSGVVRVALLLSLTLSGCTRTLPVLGPADAGAGADAGRPDARADGGPSADGPLLLYRFDEGAGDRALDSSGSGSLSHLRIDDPSRVTWTTGALRIDAPTILTTSLPPTALVEACRRSGELTVEAWVTPRDAEVSGTRRIVTLSVNSGSRDFLVGQGELFADGPSRHFSVRMRTSETDGNGLPLLSSAPVTVSASLTHVVYVREAGGAEALWVDGEVAASGARGGDLSTWDDRFRLAVGNEHDERDDARAFLGELHHLAIWARALDGDTIRSRHAEGTLE